MVRLIVYVEKGTTFKPGSLVPDHARRADYVKIHGDACGIVFGHGMEARRILESVSGITVAPPMHRTLSPGQVAVFAYAGAVQGDTTYDLAERLYAYHKMPWFHPEFEP
jgi:hypothetical protein